MIRSFLLHALGEKELVQLRSVLPDGDYLYGAKLLPEVDFSMYAEIDTAWILRDSKFNFVWPSPEAVFTSGMSDIYGVVFAMRSKASSKFLSPRQFLMDRKKEGACLLSVDSYSQSYYFMHIFSRCDRVFG